MVHIEDATPAAPNDAPMSTKRHFSITTLFHSSVHFATALRQGAVFTADVILRVVLYVVTRSGFSPDGVAVPTRPVDLRLLSDIIIAEV